MEPVIDHAMWVPLIVAVVEVAKRTPGYPAWLSPWLALALGVLTAVLWEATDVSHAPREWLVAVLDGLVTGATAAGVYDAGRTVTRWWAGRR